MKIKNKLTPYPILSRYNNDYIDSSFETVISANCIFSEIVINIDVNLVNEGLEELIDNEQAGYIMHIEILRWILMETIIFLIIIILLFYIQH